MAKSRNRSRDAKKRATKKRKNKLYQERKRMGAVSCLECGGNFGELRFDNCKEHFGIARIED